MIISHNVWLSLCVWKTEELKKGGYLTHASISTPVKNITFKVCHTLVWLLSLVFEAAAGSPARTGQGPAWLEKQMETWPLRIHFHCWWLLVYTGCWLTLTSCWLTGCWLTLTEQEEETELRQPPLGLHFYVFFFAKDCFLSFFKSCVSSLCWAQYWPTNGCQQQSCWQIKKEYKRICRNWEHVIIMNWKVKAIIERRHE